MNLRFFLEHISRNNITLLADINTEFFIDQANKSHYYEIYNFEREYFYNFITNLNSNSLYTVIPIISIKNNINEPYMVLSRSILVSKYSDYKLFREYIYSKYLKSLEDFGIDGLEDFNITLKYKKVRLDINQINKKFGK
jgi:hypothetical protein